MRFKYLFLILFFLLFSLDIKAQQELKYPKRILLIGNSYTLNNKMPSILQELINKSGDSAVVQSVAVGGYYLKNHAIDENTLKAVKQGNWDCIIIQEQSQLPALSDDIVQLESYPYITRLVDTIRAYNKCVRIGFYMTWGRKFGDTANCAKYPELCTYEGMDNALRRRYMEYSDVFRAFVVPVGLVWYYIRNFYPDIELYHPDNSHPSLLGSVVIAYSLYSAIFRKSPFEMVNYSKINLENNINIKSSIYSVITERIDWWYFSLDLAEADYNIIINDSNRVTLKNTSKNFDYFMWNYNKLKLIRSNDYTLTLENEVKSRVELIARNCLSNDKKLINLYYSTKGLLINNYDYFLKLNKRKKNIFVNINNFDIFRNYKVKIFRNNSFLLQEVKLTKENNILDLLIFPNNIYLEFYIDGEIVLKTYLNMN